MWEKVKKYRWYLGWCHSVVYRCPKRPCSYSGSPPGARGEDGRGKNGRRYTAVDRIANGTRSCRQKAVESRREGRRHETRKSHVDRMSYNRRKWALTIVPFRWLVIANNFLLQDGATPLFKAAHKGHTAVIGELLKYRPSLGILPVRVRKKSTSFKYSKNIRVWF